MTDAPVMAGVMTLDEFIRRSDQEGPFEILDGEIVPKIPTVSIHSKTIKRFLLVLLPFEQQGVGEVFQEATFVLMDTPQWVRGSRIPDLMFVVAEKLKAFEQNTPDADNKPYILVPDLVVEVVSPTDSYSDINKRVARYLNDGVRLVWVADPQTKAVTVHLPDNPQQTTLTGDMLLTGGDVLPQFSIKVAALFP